MTDHINTSSQSPAKRELGEWENPTFEAIVESFGQVAPYLRLRADRFIETLRGLGILSDQEGPEGHELL